MRVFGLWKKNMQTWIQPGFEPRVLMQFTNNHVTTMVIGDLKKKTQTCFEIVQNLAMQSDVKSLSLRVTFEAFAPSPAAQTETQSVSQITPETVQ